MPTISEVRQQYPQYSDMSDASLADALHSKFYSDMPREQFDAKIGLAKTNVASDVAKSAATGVAEGAIGLAGLPGDVGSLVSAGADKLGISADVKSAVARVGRHIPIYGAMAGPGSEDIKKTVEGYTGEFYKPQTTAGEYAKTAGEFLPAAAGGPGGIARRVAVQAVAPALASEAAGQATKGTGYEPAARIAGALAAPTVAGKIGLAREAVETVPQLREQASKLYKTAEGAGLVISKQSLQGLSADVKTAITKAGVDESLHPKALAAFRRLETGANEHQSLEGMDIIRRVAGGAAKSADADERRIARIIKDKLDDYMESLPPKDVIMGDAKAGVEALTEARPLWARMRKGEVIDDLIERAKESASGFSGSGYENALRTEFRSLAKNKSRMERFTDEEKAAIKAVGRGGPVSNAFRMLGKLAPRGVVSAALSGGIGYGVGDREGAATALIGGEIGRGIATVMTKGRARTASELIRRGGPALKAPTTDRDRIARLLALETAAQQGRR